MLVGAGFKPALLNVCNDPSSCTDDIKKIWRAEFAERGRVWNPPLQSSRPDPNDKRRVAEAAAIV